jgi:tetrathionate reductase subunit B
MQDLSESKIDATGRAAPMIARHPGSVPTSGGPVTDADTPSNAKAMYIDLRRCIGCNACSLACKQEYNVNLGERWNLVYGGETGAYPTPSIRVLPMLCHHCVEAPCKNMCDSLGFRAIQQRPDGIVFVDAARCTGCQKCIPTCRYKAIFFNAQTRKAEKCDFCRARIDAGKLPACVVTCLAITREFGTYSQLRTLHPNARSMGDGVKILYDNLGGEPENNGSTGGYPNPVECHH